jgi:hypothetical protein
MFTNPMFTNPMFTNPMFTDPMFTDPMFTDPMFTTTHNSPFRIICIGSEAVAPVNLEFVRYIPPKRGPW